MQPDLGGQDHVRARLRTPILESARAHSSRAVSLRDTVYETLSGSPPKMGAPEATSTIALSLMMILTPHSRPACWLAAWLQWQHHPRWHRWRPSAARGKPPGSGRARQVETTARPHGRRCWPCGQALSRLSSPRAGRRIDPRARGTQSEPFVAVTSSPAVEPPHTSTIVPSPRSPIGPSTFVHLPTQNAPGRCGIQRRISIP